MQVTRAPHSTNTASRGFPLAIIKNFFYYLWDSQWLTKT